MNSLFERLHYEPLSWDDALRERREVIRVLLAQQIELETLRAALNAHRAERERLLQRIARVSLAQAMRITS
jgi:hypothetical protein